MKIGMILDKTFPPDPRVENEAKQLIENGHEVFLFCLNYSGGNYFEIINGIKVCSYYFPKWIYKKISALAFTIPLYHFFLRKKIRDFIEKYQPQILHIHDMVAMQSSLNLPTSIPLVLDLHENRPEIMKSYNHVINFPGNILINVKKWKSKEREFIKKANKIVVVTHGAKEYYTSQIRNVSDKDFVVAPNTVDLDIFRKYKIEQKIIEKYSNSFTLLYLGSIGKRRGIATVIKAVNKLKKEIPNIKFVIVGGYTRDKKELEDLVKKMSLKKEIVFEGWQDVSLFPSYILASDVCLCPLKRNIHHDTTFANKLFQYMSMGRPLIVSDSTAQAELINKTKSGLVHKANSYRDLIDKIMVLYKNEKLRLELGENAKQAVEEEYNWKKSGKELINFYDAMEKNEQE